MKHVYFILSFLLFFSACNNNSTNCNKSENNTIVNDSVNPESLFAWTADSIIIENRPLVKLMDSLYLYHCRDSFEVNSFETDLEWMNNYRNQLCEYFEKTHHCIDSISSYAKADSIIEEANTLWNKYISDEASTMEMYEHNIALFSRLKFQEYNQLAQLLEFCETPNQKQILMQEFKAWLKLEHIFYQINSNCVDLYFWHGSIRKVIRTAVYNEIINSHISLYKTEINLIKDASWKGVNHNYNSDLLIDCCNSVLEECTDIEPDDLKEMSADSLYQQTIIETKKLIEQLPEVVNEWVNLRQQWTNEINDFRQNQREYSTGAILDQLSHIIC